MYELMMDQAMWEKYKKGIVPVFLWEHYDSDWITVTFLSSVILACFNYALDGYFLLFTIALLFRFSFYIERFTIVKYFFLDCMKIQDLSKGIFMTSKEENLYMESKNRERNGQGNLEGNSTGNILSLMPSFFMAGKFWGHHFDGTKLNFVKFLLGLTPLELVADLDFLGYKVDISKDGELSFNEKNVVCKAPASISLPPATNATSAVPGGKEMEDKGDSGKLQIYDIELDISKEKFKSLSLKEKVGFVYSKVLLHKNVMKKYLCMFAQAVDLKVYFSPLYFLLYTAVFGFSLFQANYISRMMYELHMEQDLAMKFSSNGIAIFICYLTVMYSLHILNPLVLFYNWCLNSLKKNFFTALIWIILFSLATTIFTFHMTPYFKSYVMGANMVAPDSFIFSGWFFLEGIVGAICGLIALSFLYSGISIANTIPGFVHPNYHVFSNIDTVKNNVQNNSLLILLAKENTQIRQMLIDSQKWETYTTIEKSIKKTHKKFLSMVRLF